MSNIRFMLFFLLFCVTKISAKAAQSPKCAPGSYLHQDGNTNICLLCPYGTFMPWTDHTADKCFNCTNVEDPAVEILIRPCDRVRDADVQCVDGFFRRLARNPREKPTCLTCRPACPQHHYPVHPCQNFSDLGCCPGENYDYVIGDGGVRMCRERPWMCRRGHYLDIGLNHCKPCPENTFMPEDYHSHIKCWDCQYLSDADLPLHAVITQPCTSIQPPRYGCTKGYYINYGMSYRGDDIGCSPCKTCDEGKYSYVGRQCDMSSDTVCCDKPNSAVLDGPQGTQCVMESNVGQVQQPHKVHDAEIDCEDGSYNPPACDKTCSQHCRVSERSDVSLCDNNSGICLFGCVDGHTGDMCEIVQQKSRNQENVNDGIGEDGYTIVPWIILVLVVLVAIVCVMYNKCCPRSGPKWWRILVSYIFRQPKKAAAEENDQGEQLRMRKVCKSFTQPEEADAEVGEQHRHLMADQWRNHIKCEADQYQIDADTTGCGHVVDIHDRTEDTTYDYNTPTCIGSEGIPRPAHSKTKSRPGDCYSSGIGREKIIL